MGARCPQKEKENLFSSLQQYHFGLGKCYVYKKSNTQYDLNKTQSSTCRHQCAKFDLSAAPVEGGDTKNGNLLVYQRLP